MRLRTSLCILAASAVLLLSAALPALAHPHVWVAARAKVLFDAQGRIEGIRHSWTFDDMYSAFATQGLGENGKPPTTEQLAPLAKTNIDSLAEFGYFTSAKEAGQKLEFGEPKDYSLEADAKSIITLNFTLPLKQPITPKKPFSFQTYDPTYFVSFGLEKKDPVSMGNAPEGCSQSVFEPQPLMAADTQKLSQAVTENVSPGADFSMRLAARVIVVCP